MIAPTQGKEAFTSFQGTKLPVFRGVRVRMGIHTGMAEQVSTNASTKRRMYGGKV